MEGTGTYAKLLHELNQNDPLDSNGLEQTVGFSTYARNVSVVRLTSIVYESTMRVLRAAFVGTFEDKC